MELTHIEHLGIAVKSIEACLPYYEEVLGLKCYNIEEVADQKVKTAFFKVGQTKIELLEPTSEDSTIAKFIEKKGEGIHHIAFAVPDVQAALDEAESKGVKLIDNCIPSPEIDMQRSDRTLHAGKIRNNGQLRIDNYLMLFNCQFSIVNCQLNKFISNNKSIVQ